MWKILLTLILPLYVQSQAPNGAPTLTPPSVTPPVATVPTLQVPTLQVPTFQIPTFQVPTPQVPTFQVPTTPVYTLAPTPRAPSDATEAPTPSDYNQPSDKTSAPTPTVMLLPQRSLPPTEEPTEEPTSFPTEGDPLWTVVDTALLTAVLGVVAGGAVAYYISMHYSNNIKANTSLQSKFVDEVATESTPLVIADNRPTRAYRASGGPNRTQASGDDTDDYNDFSEAGEESDTQRDGDAGLYYGLYMAGNTDNDLPEEEYSDYES